MHTRAPFVLAHVSDLHFSEGTDQSNPNHTHSIPHLIDLEARLRAIPDLDCLVVTGDISNHGDRQSLVTASGWFFGTIPIGNGQHAGLNCIPDCVRVVPGNHDAWNASRTGRLIDRRQRSLANFNYAFPQHSIPHGGCHYDWLQKGTDGLYLAFVDSCFLEDTEPSTASPFGTLRYDKALAKGRLTVTQTEQLLEWHDKGGKGLLEDPRSPGACIEPSVFVGSLKVLVMHHYLFEPPEKRSDYFMRVQHRDIVFRNVALSDFDVLLCGHKHVAAFDVHDYGDHFDARAVTRYMANYLRRLIGLESLPIQFVDNDGRRLARSLTQLVELIGGHLKRAWARLSCTASAVPPPDLADEVFRLLKDGLQNPDGLRQRVLQFLRDAGSAGASLLDARELKAIQKRIAVGLSKADRAGLRTVADGVSRMSKGLRARQFLQVMAGSSAKASSSPEQKRSFNISHIRRSGREWRFVCDRYSWDGTAFTDPPTSREHIFKKPV